MSGIVLKEDKSVSSISITETGVKTTKAITQICINKEIFKK